MPNEEQHEPLAFVLYQQDWRGHQFGDPQPPVVQMRFDTRDEAEKQKHKLRERFPDADIVLLCVAPVPAPGKAKKKGRRS